MTEIQIDEFGRAAKYESPDISGHETAVKNRISDYADLILEGKTDSEKREMLNEAKKAVHLIVDYVMQHLPTGVDRVDGNVIKPLRDEVISNKLAEIPVEEVTEEI